MTAYALRKPNLKPASISLIEKTATVLLLEKNLNLKPRDLYEWCHECGLSYPGLSQHLSAKRKDDHTPKKPSGLSVEVSWASDLFGEADDTASRLSNDGSSSDKMETDSLTNEEILVNEGITSRKENEHTSLSVQYVTPTKVGTSASETDGRLALFHGHENTPTKRDMPVRLVESSASSTHAQYITPTKGNDSPAEAISVCPEERLAEVCGNEIAATKARLRIQSHISSEENAAHTNSAQSMTSTNEEDPESNDPPLLRLSQKKTSGYDNLFIPSHRTGLNSARQPRERIFWTETPSRLISIQPLKSSSKGKSSLGKHGRDSFADNHADQTPSKAPRSSAKKNKASSVPSPPKKTAEEVRAEKRERAKNYTTGYKGTSNLRDARPLSERYGRASSTPGSVKKSDEEEGSKADRQNTSTTGGRDTDEPRDARVAAEQLREASPNPGSANQTDEKKVPDPLTKGSSISAKKKGGKTIEQPKKAPSSFSNYTKKAVDKTSQTGGYQSGGKRGHATTPFDNSKRTSSSSSSSSKSTNMAPRPSSQATRAPISQNERVNPLKQSLTNPARGASPAAQRANAPKPSSTNPARGTPYPQDKLSRVTTASCGTVSHSSGRVMNSASHTVDLPDPFTASPKKSGVSFALTGKSAPTGKGNSATPANRGIRTRITPPKFNLPQTTNRQPTPAHTLARGNSMLSLPANTPTGPRSSTIQYQSMNTSQSTNPSFSNRNFQNGNNRRSPNYPNFQEQNNRRSPNNRDNRQGPNNGNLINRRNNQPQSRPSSVASQQVGSSRSVDNMLSGPGRQSDGIDSPAFSGRGNGDDGGKKGGDGGKGKGREDGASAGGRWEKRY